MQDHHSAAASGSEPGAPAPLFAETQQGDPGGYRDLRGDDRPRRLKVEFTGSGSEYFRIWIVNLLLTIVTLSFYRPFAKARRLAYFHGNTLVGGQPLGFHGNPWKMLRGYLLMLLFGAVYLGASQFSPVAAMVAIGSFVLLWPALWRASLQFRLANTSWRGLRMGFTGGLGGAYLTMLPGVLPWLGFIGAAFLMQPAADAADAVTPAAPPAAALAVLGLSFVATLALMPLSLAWVKRYQHNHYTYAGQRSELIPGAGSFYGFVFKVIGVSLLVAVGSLVVIAVLMFLVVGIGSVSDMGPQAAALAGLLGGLVFYGLYFVFTMPYAQSRLQNLVWGGTRSQSLRWRSELKMLPLGLLTLKNLVLVVLTLGLYWPFAAVAMARMRLQAVSLDLDGDLTQWQAGRTSGQNDATGDAAGDFFGIDMGL
jgi:uncharacterized membrane protein YjgN (DUF898 family)